MFARLFVTIVTESPALSGEPRRVPNVATTVLPPTTITPVLSVSAVMTTRLHGVLAANASAVAAAATTFRPSDIRPGKSVSSILHRPYSSLLIIINRVSYQAFSLFSLPIGEVTQHPFSYRLWNYFQN
jgi:hypothetical protein